VSLYTTTQGRTLLKDGKPFFLLGDTAWLLLTRLKDEEVLRYFDHRQAQGFNTILFTAVHNLEPDRYGNVAFANGHFEAQKNSYWERVQWIVSVAQERGLLIGLLPVWGSTYVANGSLNEGNCQGYARFLSELLNANTNVLWILGGDIRGDVHPDVWDKMANVFQENTPRNLIAFHPFGRTSSSQWFHNRTWLSLNMFQSGHRRYDQIVLPGTHDDPNPDHFFGEDNWRYCQEDFARVPAKPTLDAEPSYEDIPQGLHDGTQPRWTALEIRRYAWWAALAGACGHVYGHNSVMQMLSPGVKAAFSATTPWNQALDAPGSNQMRIVKETMLSLGSWGSPAQELICNTAERHERVAAYQTKDGAILYSFTGKPFALNTALLPTPLHAQWIRPDSGEISEPEFWQTDKLQCIRPPKEGTDWALLLRFKKGVQL
jgi:hypothetical protein